MHASAVPDVAAQKGFSVIEMTVAALLALVVLLAAYDFLDWTNRGYMKESGLADAQNTGRATLDLFVSELRTAGYSPLGYPFYAIPGGNAARVRMLADLDGDNRVGTPGETDENVSYVFRGPDPSGLYTLLRGIDLNEDWLFTGSGESVATVATGLVQIDANKDGTVEPFIAYDLAPPAATIAYNPATPALSRVTITFGVRSANRDPISKTYPIVNFQSDISLRNRNY